MHVERNQVGSFAHSAHIDPRETPTNTTRQNCVLRDAWKEQQNSQWSHASCSKLSQTTSSRTVGESICEGRVDQTDEAILLTAEGATKSRGVKRLTADEQQPVTFFTAAEKGL